MLQGVRQACVRGPGMSRSTDREAPLGCTVLQTDLSRSAAVKCGRMRLRRVPSALAVGRCWDAVDADWHAVLRRPWPRLDAGSNSGSGLLLCYSSLVSALLRPLLCDECAFGRLQTPSSVSRKAGAGWKRDHSKRGAREARQQQQRDAVPAVVLHLHMMVV